MSSPRVARERGSVPAPFLVTGHRGVEANLTTNCAGVAPQTKKIALEISTVLESYKVVERHRAVVIHWWREFSNSLCVNNIVIPSEVENPSGSTLRQCETTRGSADRLALRCGRRSCKKTPNRKIRSGSFFAIHPADAVGRI